MSALRERTNYIVSDAVDGEPVLGGSWANIRETPEGGAIVSMCIDTNIDRLEIARLRLKEQGKNVDMIINDIDDEFILIDENGGQVPFDIVMKVLFD